MSAESELAKDLESWQTINDAIPVTEWRTWLERNADDGRSALDRWFQNRRSTFPMFHLADGPIRNEVLPNLWIGAIEAAKEPEKYDVIVNASGEFVNHVKGKVYILFPISDCRELPDKASIWLIAHQIARSVRRGKRVLVHCHMGLNRSGLLMAAAVMLLNGINGKEAVRLVRSKRDYALCNPDFRKWLEKQPRPRRRKVA